MCGSASRRGRASRKEGLGSAVRAWAGLQVWRLWCPETGATGWREHMPPTQGRSGSWRARPARSQPGGGNASCRAGHRSRKASCLRGERQPLFLTQAVLLAWGRRRGGILYFPLYTCLLFIVLQSPFAYFCHWEGNILDRFLKKKLLFSISCDKPWWKGIFLKKRIYVYSWVTLLYNGN